MLGGGGSNVGTINGSTAIRNAPKWDKKWQEMGAKETGTENRERKETREEHNTCAGDGVGGRGRGSNRKFSAYKTYIRLACAKRLLEDGRWEEGLRPPLRRTHTYVEETTVPNQINGRGFLNR